MGCGWLFSLASSGLFLALFGHGEMSDLSLLWGVKRKSGLWAVRSEFDP
jgi:hypothetical protein